MYHKPSAQSLLHPPHPEPLHERLEPVAKDIAVPQLLRDDAHALAISPLCLLLLLLLLLVMPLLQPTCFCARLHKRLDQRIVVHAVCGKYRIEPRRRLAQRSRHLVLLPVQRPERHLSPRPLVPVGSDVLPEQLLHIVLVGQNIRPDERGERKGVQRGDAAAQLEDGGRRAQEVVEERIRPRGEPLGE
ncbi:hypothetical protein AAL_02730 [Moelleriella libera RCEF 2490]|uniref:Uncharacterized protein n=1 Tax=Moelleriella libera RCEF 2490 TaxID=1081109 RepID=A0A168EV43_9HYPO|nr:hypothetical protein AAL_02730 [Moelleriella libera RCEF 2490]